MDHLEDEEEREDEKFWDDLGDELKYEDPDDLDDHQKEKKPPRDLMSIN